MTNMTLQALRSLVADDAYASSYQSMAHYRGALLKLFDTLALPAAVAVQQSAIPGALDWIPVVVRDVADLPDRGSPADWPDAMLVTAGELREIIDRHATSATGAPETPGQSDMDAYANSGYHRFMTFDTFKAFRADCIKRAAQPDGGQGDERETALS